MPKAVPKTKAKRYRRPPKLRAPSRLPVRLRAECVGEDYVGKLLEDLEAMSVAADPYGHMVEFTYAKKRNFRGVTWPTFELLREQDIERFRDELLIHPRCQSEPTVVVNDVLDAVPAPGLQVPLEVIDMSSFDELSSVLRELRRLNVDVLSAEGTSRRGRDGAKVFRSRLSMLIPPNLKRDTVKLELEQAAHWLCIVLVL